MTSVLSSLLEDGVGMLLAANSDNHKNTYIHSYSHTYIHTYIHIHILTYIHTYILTYIHTVGGRQRVFGLRRCAAEGHRRVRVHIFALYPHIHTYIHT